MKKLLIITVTLGLMLLLAWFGIKDALNPIERVGVQQPIYTIGDLNYAEALTQHKKIVKFGPVFWGIYPGGLAFRDVSEAENFIENNNELLNEFSDGWAIYELSGDFDIDTVINGDNRYIDKSLFVVKIVAKP